MDKIHEFFFQQDAKYFIFKYKIINNGKRKILSLKI